MDYTELLFQEIKQDKEATRKAYHYIENTINSALPVQDLELLFSLIPYIDTGEGASAYKYIFKVHRLFQILNITKLEHELKRTLFLTNCFDLDALYSKYMLSLFAFRRLLFHLSNQSAAEAVSYLRQTSLSMLAAYMIIQFEIGTSDSAFCNKIIDIYSDLWSDYDKDLFASSIEKGGFY